MSYTNTTTHFQWPLPDETDLFNGLDDNQMKEDLDEKVYNLEQQSTGDHEAVTLLNSRVAEVEQTVGGYDTQIEELKGTVGEHAERLINLTNRQTELSRRLNGKAGESTIAPEYNEEESYIVGDFVYYANILYKCSVASATPAGAFNSDNWDVAILTNELGGSTPTPGTIAAANVSFDDAVAQLGASNVQAALVALKTLIDNIGGDGMSYDYDNLVSILNNTALNYTVPKRGVIKGSYFYCVTPNQPTTLTINGKAVLTINASTVPNQYINLEVDAGDVVKTAAGVNGSMFAFVPYKEQ